MAEVERSLLSGGLTEHAQQLLQHHKRLIYRRCDRMFAGLLILQWVAGTAIAVGVSPRTWVGSASYIHPHVWAAIVVGTPLISLPVWLSIRRPGEWYTRHIIAAAQMLDGALLIHLSGGRIETHFHVFGSLAFIAFYRDWRVLLTATAVVAGDHFLRGVFWPMSVFGTNVPSPGRALEHSAWVLFEVVFLVAACRQSQREMAEIAMRRSADEAAADWARADRDELLTTLNAGTIVARPASAGILIWVTDRSCAVSGYGRDELLGRHLGYLGADAEAANRWDQMARTISNGDLWQGEIHNRTKDGRDFWVSATSKGFLGANGRLARAVHVQTDITADKEAERNHAQAARLESIGRLAAGIAHEINTPTQYVGDNVRFAQDGFIAMAKGFDQYAALLGEPALPWAERREKADATRKELDLDFLRDEVPQAVAQALEGLERVTQIVAAMKVFSHPGSAHREPADLNRAILSTIEVCRNRWKYIAELQTDLQPDLPPVPCLVAEFNQVVLNLIVNAADALGEVVTPPGTEPRKAVIRVVTRVTADGQFAEVDVADNGPGIPPAVQQRIFEPFFTTKPLGKGTGQGLTLSRDVIVKRHGGHMSFQSSAAGTTFTIRLPLTAPVAIDPAEATAIAA